MLVLLIPLNLQVSPPAIIGDEKRCYMVNCVDGRLNFFCAAND
jgi:hypothetical protein